MTLNSAIGRLVETVWKARLASPGSSSRLTQEGFGWRSISFSSCSASADAKASPGVNQDHDRGSVPPQTSADGGNKAGIPMMPKVLGLAGALPFWFTSPAISQHVTLIDSLTGGLSAADSITLQLSYGATILSFLGGVHWGLAMTNVTPMKRVNERFLWSVTPCLLGFPTLVLPGAEAAGIQAVLLGLVYVIDRSWARQGMLPPWYMKLRTPLTVMASTGLGLTALSGLSL